MSLKRDSASIRIVRVGEMCEVSLVHRSRRGKQTVVRPVLCGPRGDSLRSAVRQVVRAGAERLRVPEEVYAEWQSATSPE